MRNFIVAVEEYVVAGGAFVNRAWAQYVRALGGNASTDSGFRFTGLYASRLLSRYHSECFSQWVSSRSGKSLRACAPRDSWRASAETMVALAVSTRLSSSSAST